MDELLRDILSFLQNIQRLHKASIGAINNTYLPQLSIDAVDRLAARVAVLALRAEGRSRYLQELSGFIAVRYPDIYEAHLEHEGQGPDLDVYINRLYPKRVYEIFLAFGNRQNA